MSDTKIFNRDDLNKLEVGQCTEFECECDDGTKTITSVCRTTEKQFAFKTEKMKEEE